MCQYYNVSKIINVIFSNVKIYIYYLLNTKTLTGTVFETFDKMSTNKKISEGVLVLRL